MTTLPAPHAAARIADFLADHLRWSAYWDKHAGLWRVSQDEPTPPCPPRARTPMWCSSTCPRTPETPVTHRNRGNRDSHLTAGPGPSRQPRRSGSMTAWPPVPVLVPPGDSTPPARETGPDVPADVPPWDSLVPGAALADSLPTCQARVPRRSRPGGQAGPTRAGQERPGLRRRAYGPPAMPGPAPARTPAKQSPAAPAAPREKARTNTSRKR
jgi:hypothetical protein